MAHIDYAVPGPFTDLGGISPAALESGDVTPRRSGGRRRYVATQ